MTSVAWWHHDGQTGLSQPGDSSGETDGFLFHILPYIEGESLGDRLVQDLDAA